MIEVRLGDNLEVLRGIPERWFDLIYIDPPFDVGADFTMTVPIGDEKETVGKDQSTLGDGGLSRHVGQRHRLLSAHDV